MKNFETTKSEIVDSTLVKIYKTLEPFTTFWFEGLGNLLSYKFIIEIEGGIKYELGYDYLLEWNDEEKIVELKTDFKNKYYNKKIIDLISDFEDESIYLKLEDEMVLYHDNTFGSELGFEKYSNIFDEKGKLI